MIKYICILSTLFFAYCRGKDEQLNCLETSLINEENKQHFLEIRNNLADTLNVWINKGYERVQILKNVNWKIDEAVFTSPEKDKAILLILEQDLARRILDPEALSNETKSLDFIHLIYANKETDGWHYYYQSMPLITVPREKNNLAKPISFEKLSLIGRRDIIKNYYESGTCTYNVKFFDRWDINNLKEKHKKINGY